MKVLQLLHNLVGLVGIEFPTEAMNAYFGPDQASPSVHNHPKATAATTTYSNHLTAFATAGNPQEETPPTHTVDSNRTAKRTRDGNLRKNQTYANAATASSITTSYGADVDDLLSRLQNNLTFLNSVETKHQHYDDTFKKFGERFEKVETGLEGHGKILKALSKTQEKQGRLMNNKDKKTRRPHGPSIRQNTCHSRHRNGTPY